MATASKIRTVSDNEVYPLPPGLLESWGCIMVRVQFQEFKGVSGIILENKGVM
jgi:hypothetical protein